LVGYVHFGLDVDPQGRGKRDAHKFIDGEMESDCEADFEL
jgi:hypothetical protein